MRDRLSVWHDCPARPEVDEEALKRGQKQPLEALDIRASQGQHRIDSIVDGHRWLQPQGLCCLI